MIDFRYHVVSIVAVFLALALGLFIGSTSLRGPVANDIASRTKDVTDKNRQLTGQLADAQSRLKQQQAFDAALAPYAVNTRLAGQSIAIVSAPGADDALRTALVNILTTAGATVTADVRLQGSLLDPRQDQFLTTLTGRLALPGHPLPPGTGAERAAAELADVLGTRPGARPVPQAAAAAVLSAYSDGQLLTVSGNARPGTLAVVLAAPPSTSADQQAQQAQDAANTVILTLARDLDGTAAGAVIVGPSVAAGTGGLVAAARADTTASKGLSTVDDVDLPSGQIALVFALAEQMGDGSGNYGTAAGADAPLPRASPSP